MGIFYSPYSTGMWLPDPIKGFTSLSPSVFDDLGRPLPSFFHQGPASALQFSPKTDPTRHLNFPDIVCGNADLAQFLFFVLSSHFYVCESRGFFPVSRAITLSNALVLLQVALASCPETDNLLAVLCRALCFLFF